MTRKMKIGDFARTAGCRVETIRYYEREGLLREPARTNGNYRLYGEEQVERLRFIRHCRSLDMTLEEIRGLLQFRDAPEEDCGEVNALLDEHISHVASRIGELKALERELRSLRAMCASASAIRDCGILHKLATASAAVSGAAPRGHVPGAHAGHKDRSRQN